MGKIFCLMGKSSSGKDTIFKQLELDNEIQLKPIVLYTTRPKRSNEIDGVTYNFVTKDILDKYEAEGKMIEQRVYNTVNGDWHYCTIDDGNINLDKNDYLIITTLEAYEKLQSYFGNVNVVPLYIEIDDGVRLERALERERLQEKPNYDELCRRYLADSYDFSEDKLNQCNIVKSFNNIDLNDCISEIKEEILRLKNN